VVACGDFEQLPHGLAWTLVPGILAVVMIGVLVCEKPKHRPATGSFWFGIRQLPPPFRRFLVAVGIFAVGDFSHTLLILFATQVLTPTHGRAKAASIAVGLYLLHNIFMPLLLTSADGCQIMSASADWCWRQGTDWLL
jgi:hypothetical protein